jgi:trigger factor
VECCVKITQEEVVDRQTVLEIELEDEDMAPYLDRAYRRVVQQTNVPGFRKGKAPRSIIEGILGRERLVAESLDDVLPAVTHQAIVEQELDAAGTPQVELVALDPVTVKATVPLTPAVELGGYLDVRVEEDPVEVADEDIDAEIESLREREAIWEPVERLVQMGDRITMAAVGHVGEESIIDTTDTEYMVDEEAALPFPGFAEEVVGAAVDSPVEFHLTIPDDYFNAPLAGEEAHFRITVKEIKERSLPNLDDEFAKGIGDGFDTLEELTESVRSRIATEAEQARDMKLREDALDKLVEGAEFDIPPLLIDREIQHMTERRDEFIGRMNVTLDEYYKFAGTSEEEQLAEIKEQAVDRFSRTHALYNLAKAESIEVSDEEVEQRLADLRETASADGSGLDESNLDRPEAVETIRESMLIGKAMDRLVEIATGRADGTTDDGGDPNDGSTPDNEGEKEE